jgi:hypothetical protein
MAYEVYKLEQVVVLTPTPTVPRTVSKFEQAVVLTTTPPAPYVVPKFEPVVVLTEQIPAAIAGNVAASVNGAVASTDSENSTDLFKSSVAINLDRKGHNGISRTYWYPASAGFPHWLQIDFDAAYDLDEVNVFHVQDDRNNPVEPTLDMTGSSYMNTAFTVEYWDGDSWEVFPGGSVTGNNKVWFQLLLSQPINTDKIRVNVTAGATYARIVEVEAWKAEVLVGPTLNTVKAYVSSASDQLHVMVPDGVRNYKIKWSD